MASLQSNPLGEEMQEVLGVVGDYDHEEYEVKTINCGERKFNMNIGFRWELREGQGEASHTQEAGQIPQPP